MYDQAIFDLYHKYRHTPMDRRAFMRRRARLAGGTAAAVAILPLLERDPEATKGAWVRTLAFFEKRLT